MNTSAATSFQGPITLYNAGDRYKRVREILESSGELVDQMKPTGHPGIFDLQVHLTMLITAVNAAEPQFGPSGMKTLNPKSIRMLSNLEQLVEEFESIVNEAKAELLP